MKTPSTRQMIECCINGQSEQLGEAAGTGITKYLGSSRVGVRCGCGDDGAGELEAEDEWGLHQGAIILVLAPGLEQRIS